MKYTLGVMALLASFTTNAAVFDLGTITPQTTKTVFNLQAAGIFGDEYTFSVADTFAFTSNVTGSEMSSFTLSINNLDTSLKHAQDALTPLIAPTNGFEAVITEKTLSAGNYMLAVDGTGFSLGSSYIGSFTVGRPINVAAVAAVPEPETYAMFLAGLGLLAFTAKRRTK